MANFLSKLSCRFSIKINKYKMLYVMPVFVVCIIAFFIYRYWRYIKSPEYIRDKTIHALMIRDAQTIYHLGCPEERKLLNITPQAVQDILKRSIWSHGFPQDPSYRPFGPNPEGVRQWIVHWRHPKFKQGQDMDMLVMQNPDGSWGLNVSWLLCCACNLTGASWVASFEQYNLKGYCLMDYYFDIKGHRIEP